MAWPVAGIAMAVSGPIFVALTVLMVLGRLASLSIFGLMARTIGLVIFTLWAVLIA